MNFFHLNFRPQRFLGLLVGLLSGVVAANAQGYHSDFYPQWHQNPGGLNEDPEVPPGAGAAPGWTEVYRCGLPTNTGMTRGLVLPPGFTFRFHGQAVTAVRAFENYFLVFDTLQTRVIFINNNLPNPTAPNRFAYIGYGWTGSNTNQTRILTKTFGTAPHRQFWVQWNNMKVATSPAGVLPAYISYVLEEGTDRIHLVIQRESWWVAGAKFLGSGLQLNGTTAWVADTIRVRRAHQNDPRPLDNLTITFEPGARRATDAAMWAAWVPAGLLAPGPASAPLRGAVVNQGTQPLPNWRVAYCVDTGPVQFLAPSATVLAPGDTAAFAFPAGWTRPAPGRHQLRVWVQAMAGQPDLNPHNDTLSLTLQVASRAVPRRVVQEIATSSTCPPCAIFDDSLHAVDRRRPPHQVDRIAYPMNFPGTGDPYYLPEFRVRAQANVRNVRNVVLSPALGTPLMVANGTTVVDPTNRFFFPPLPPYDSLLVGLTGKLAPLALSGTCRVGGDSVQGTLTLEPLVALPGRAYTLLAVITERTTTGNATTNGVTEFHDVVKKIVLTHPLTAPLEPGQPLTIPYAHFFAPGHTVEHFDSLEVTAFVQYSALNGSTAPFDVVQSVRLRPAHLPPLGAPALRQVALGWTLVPNPTTGRATLSLTLPTAAPVAVEVRDALGRQVLTNPARELPAGEHVLPLELRGRPAGLYVVRLTLGAIVRTQRLVIE
ncbi:MAG: T9SS type A sorting domain-containing protein [Hymenobacteraceae bacterium]|nr:T9SS type A sorting domain-containing protein [Hymenobacteraceae bacterium]